MGNTRSLKCQGRTVAVLPARFGRFAAFVVLIWLIAAAAIVASRAYAGAFRSPLPSVAMLTAGLLVGLAGVVIRLGWFLPQGDERIGRLDHAVMTLTTLAVASLCGVLSLPHGTPIAAAVFLRLLFVAEEGWAWFWFFWKWRRPAPQPSKTFRVDSAHPATSRHIVPSEPVCAAADLVEPLNTAPPAEVTQQLTRSRAADGTEELFGWLRTPFAPGQRTASIHVAFCPPLAVTPEVEVEQIEGPDARIKTAQLLPYGARFDLKLATASNDAATVVLQFMARTPQEAAHEH
jgi:hypothetical protein